jgi:hypothetical protein
MGSQVHRIVGVSLKGSAFHKTEELNGDQPFLFLVDFKISFVSAGMGLPLELALMLWSVGAAEAIDAGPKR